MKTREREVSQVSRGRMKEAPLPQNESQRLEVLDRYKILDTPSERDFDDLVKLAAQICQTPISLVSLVARDRQWFKGRYGLEITETPRRISFCAHSILNPDEPTEVTDATRDPRFSDNELVTGQFHLRYYLGAPLVTPGGFPLGTLCVIDTRPRQLTPEQKEALQILARQVMSQLELRRSMAEAASERERELQESETRLRLAVETAELGTYERDLATNEVSLNETCKRIFGLETGSPTPDVAVRSLHPEDEERVLAAVARAFDPAIRETCADDFRILRPDGTVRWVSGRGRVLFNDAYTPARPSKFIGALSDITQRKESEERYRTLFDAIDEGFCIVEMLLDKHNHPVDYRFLETNRSFEQLTGLSAARGKRMREMVPDHEEHWFEAYGKVALTGQPARFQQQAAKLYRWYDVYAFRFGPAERRQVAVLFADITEQKVQEHSLREQAHLAQLRADMLLTLQQPAPLNTLLHQAVTLLVERLDAAFARVWTLDPTGQTLELQASAGMYTHLDGPHSRVAVGQLKIGRIAQERRPLFTNQVIGDPNISGQDWARREGLVAFAGFPLLLEGRLLGVVALFARHALSEAARETFGIVAGTLAQGLGRVAAEQALRATKEELARANADLEQRVRERTAQLEESVAELEHFSYTITHDMRAPLRGMRGFAAILASAHAQSLSEEGQDLLRRISDAALRMDHLITDALNYGSVVRSQLPLRPVDPVAVLKGIIESYPQFHPPAAVIHIEDGIPSLLANEAALTQCFSNLLGNAVKFVAPGVVPRIRIWAESSRLHSLPSVRIWIQDNGIGIPPQYHEKIWDMFLRLDKTYEGTGIGLALVHKVVNRMNGRVGVESEPGQGSRFWIELYPSKDQPQQEE